MTENNTELQTDNRHSDLLDAIHKSDLTRAVRVKLGALLNVPQVWATAEYAELLDVMAKATTELRRWPVGSPQPCEDGLRVQSTTNHVIFRYKVAWDRWLAEQESGGDGNDYSWHALNSEHASEGGMELVEVPGAGVR